MYGYLYCENEGLERLLVDVGFVLNLNINAKKIAFLMLLKPYLRVQAHACVHRLLSCVRRFMLA